MKRMESCAICGKPMIVTRSTKRTCSDRCRRTAFVRRQRLLQAERSFEDWIKLGHGALVQRLQEVLPDTAERLHLFAIANGVECADAALKLVLSAYAETIAIERSERIKPE